MFDQIDDGRQDVAIVDDFGGLFAEVVDAEHTAVFEDVECLGVAFGGGEDLPDVDDVHIGAVACVEFLVVEKLEVVAAIEIVDASLKGFHEGGLAVADSAAEDDAGLGAWGGDERGKGGEVGGGIIVGDEPATAAIDFGRVEGGQQIESLLRGEIESKTRCRSHPASNFRHQFLDALQVDLESVAVCQLHFGGIFGF